MNKNELRTWLKKSIIFLCAKRIYHAILFIPIAKLIFAFIKSWRLLITSRYDFLRLISSKEQFVLFFMHTFGGGTEVYIRNTINGRKHCIILRSLDILGKKELYTLEVVNTGSHIIISKYDISKLSKIAETVSVENLCGYKNISFILSELQHFPCKIIFKLHDFYSICPRITMVKNNLYCGTSCSENCRHIVGKKEFTSSQWRKTWQVFFNRVDEFFFFSESSRTLFTSFFSIPQEKIHIQPHDMSYFKTKKITHLPEKLNIGVFGNINSDAKGKTVLKNFINFLKNYDYKICINGNPGKENEEDFMQNKNCVCYGSYKPEEIYTRLISQKIGVVFFTSICPETFSYVISELMMTEIPIVCFDIGAQAEKVKAYHLGKIIPQITNEEILKTITNCYRDATRYFNSI